jgi:hypothetical protein
MKVDSDNYGWIIHHDDERHERYKFSQSGDIFDDAKKELMDLADKVKTH